MRRTGKKIIRRLILAITGLMCGTSCAFFVIAEEPVKNLIIQDGTAQIEKYEYSDNVFLESVYIPGSVKNVGVSAFEGCSALTNLQIQNGVSALENKSFASCVNLKQVALPDSITQLGNGAFYRCTTLKEVILPNQINKIENNLFYQCNELSNIVIPESVASIGQQSFYHCNSLTSIQLPNSLTSIGEGAFYDCSGLTNINIPDSVNYIGSNAFTGCNQLTIHCSEGSYAEQYAKNNGLNVYTGSKVEAENAVDVQATVQQHAQTAAQNPVIPQTGVECHYGIYVSMIILAAAGLLIVRKKENCDTILWK